MPFTHKANHYTNINMNGRLYDPLLGRMLSPDPNIQDPANSQNFNRYSYALNNPMVYTDPSGYYIGGGSNSYFIDGQEVSDREFNAYMHGLYGSDSYSIEGYGDVYDKYIFNLLDVERKIALLQFLKDNENYKPWVWKDKPHGSKIEIEPATFTWYGESYTYGKGATSYVSFTDNSQTTDYENETFNANTYMHQEASSDFGYHEANSGENENHEFEQKITMATSPFALIGEAAKMTYNEMSKADQLLKTSKYLKYIGNIKYVGIAGELVNTGKSIIDFRNSPTWGNAARVNNAVGTMCLNRIPYGGPIISIIWGAIDVSGGFNDVYNYLDEQQKLYNKK